MVINIRFAANTHYISLLIFSAGRRGRPCGVPMTCGAAACVVPTSSKTTLQRYSAAPHRRCHRLAPRRALKTPHPTRCRRHHLARRRRIPLLHGLVPVFTVHAVRRSRPVRSIRARRLSLRRLQGARRHRNPRRALRSGRRRVHGAMGRIAG